MSVQKNTVIICPLDWGLGHATRMVPVINLFIKYYNKVVIAADNRPMAFLKQHFPNCTFETLPGYSPSYPKHGFLMPWIMMMSYPKMLINAQRSRKLLKKLVNKYQATLVVSDNRYELSLPKTYSIFITHQLHIQTFGWQKLFNNFINRSVKKYLNNYQEVWIPDSEGLKNLSGILGHPPLNIKPKQTYIGLLSRFAEKTEVSEPIEHDIVIILSGPEPQRTMLENKLMEQASQHRQKTLVIQGKPEHNNDILLKNIRLISHANDRQMMAYLKGAQLVVCRPGYSTLMDLAFLQKKAAFIPTPGQTEQVYLANKLYKEKAAYFDSQQNFSLLKAFETRNQYKGLPTFEKNKLLENTIQRLVKLELNPNNRSFNE